MKKAERYQKVIQYFLTHTPFAETELQYQNPYQLLVAVILSAQCTDKRVNLVTPQLFRDFPTPQRLAQTHFDTLFPYIRSISYPNNKTKHLIGMAQKLVQNFDSQVPNNIPDLISLQGVGRKTANVILSVVYNQAAMAVDTHVYRVSARLGLTTAAKTPLETEKQLMKFIPQEYVATAHHWLILHGRYTCLARSPKCTDCGLKDYCKYHASQLKKGAVV
ncbi:MAG: endonuclease III [bacterium]|nr:endonuclease III [bacterium]